MFLDDIIGPMSVAEAKKLSGADKFRKTISDIETKHQPGEERYNRLKSDPDYREQEFQKWQKEVHGDKAVQEAETDYSKRRQREKDVDAGKPVAKQRQYKMTDYQKRRAQQKREMELGESTNYLLDKTTERT
jgi:hypothetical protein